MTKTTIPDGYYINWHGDSALVYDNKRWSLVCFIKLCDALDISRNKMRDWLKESKIKLKILDPLWNDIQKLPLVTLQNINLFL